MSKDRPLLSLVVPCYNEEEVLMTFYDVCLNELDVLSEELSLEFVFVDDGSKDKTLSIMRELAGMDKRVNYISFSRNFGKEAGILAGLKAARGDYVVLMDADLQHPPKYIPDMYRILSKEGFDSVAMKRHDRKSEGGARAFFSKCFFKLISKISDISFPEGATDFRMMNRKFVDAVLSMTEYNRFTKGIFEWVGFKTYWMSYENEERAGGRSKWNLKSLIKYSLDGMVAFSTRPLTLASILGLLIFAVSVVMMLWVVIKTLIWGDPVAGYPTLICVILMMSGLQLLFLGILGQYFAKAYMEVKGRPVYISKETIIQERKNED